MKTPGALRPKINKLLKDFFVKKKKEGKKQGTYYQELIEQIESITLRGGDKMRPLLVYYSYMAIKNNLSDEEENRLLAISLCTELFHTACLIHDDLMDQSLVRRGGLTIHQYFFDKFKKEKLGKDLAVLAGDLALVWADEIFHKVRFSSSEILRAQKYFNLLREEVIFGQQLDLLLSDHFPWSQTSEDLVLKMYQYKTAKYSFERPIHLGLALAGASEKTFEIFSKYALSVGVAFQIKDDILGSFGDSKKTGKQIDDDIKGKKKTLLMVKAKAKIKNILLHQKLAGREKLVRSEVEGFKFNKLLIKANLDSKDIKTIKKAIVISGALKECQEMAKKLTEEGKKAIIESDIKQEAKRFFLELADYAVEREE